MTRIIQDAVHTPVYESIRNWSVDSGIPISAGRAYSSAAIEASARASLRKWPPPCQDHVQRRSHFRGEENARGRAFNNTVGLPGHFSSRLQPNDTRDEIPSIVAAGIRGLSYGAGDAVIGINPVTDTVSTKAMLNALWEIIERHQIPTQNCVLAHVTTQMEAIRQGANAGMIFQSIAGSEKGLREFGVTTGLLDGRMISRGITVRPPAPTSCISRRAGLRAVGGRALRL